MMARHLQGLLKCALLTSPISICLRVAIKVKDIIIDRDARHEKERLELTDRLNQNATKEDIDKGILRLASASFGSNFSDANKGMLDNARDLVNSTTSLDAGGSASELASQKRKIGDIKSMMEEYDAEEERKNKKAKEEAEAQQAETQAPSGDDPAPVPQEAAWHQRDTKISDALSAQESWQEAQEEAITLILAKAKNTLKLAADPEISDMCRRDSDILANRLHALRLVKGGAESIAAVVELKQATAPAMYVGGRVG